MGKQKFDPCRSETPENIEAKLGVNDYVMYPYKLSIFCGNRSNAVAVLGWGQGGGAQAPKSCPGPPNVG